ncbi:heterokaryon incompatibility protein domain-containing protein [Trichoderma evansii]
MNVHQTLENIKQSITTQTAQTEEDEDDDEDGMANLATYMANLATNTYSPSKKNTSHNHISKHRGITHSRGGVPLSVKRGRNKRRNYPSPRRFDKGQITTKKRVRTVFNYPRRLAKHPLDTVHRHPNCVRTCCSKRICFACGHFEWEGSAQECNSKRRTAAKPPRFRADPSFCAKMGHNPATCRKRSNRHLDHIADRECTFCSRLSSRLGHVYSSFLVLQGDYSTTTGIMRRCEDLNCCLPFDHPTPHLYRLYCLNCDCVLPFKHKSYHRYWRSRPQIENELWQPLYHKYQNACSEPNCILPQRYQLNHEYWQGCQIPKCFLCRSLKEQNITPRVSKEAHQWLYERKEKKAEFDRWLNDMVFRDMDSLQAANGTQASVRKLSTKRMPIDTTANIAALQSAPVSYSKLKPSRQQIRLLEIYPGTDMMEIQGLFHCVDLSNCPEYIALSYTWGEDANHREITVNGNKLPVRDNLWRFLHLQSSSISEPKLFWIDAICINQSDICERNHQVGMMRQIYTNAAEVYIWLGQEADDSAVAMDFFTRKVPKELRPKGRWIWSKKEGRAISKLFKRPYWGRMWIIQEVISAGYITVWCGTGSFEWALVEKLYWKLSVLKSRSWLYRCAYANRVFKSSACVIVWERAHWRHPDTPTPSLQKLIEVFHRWQCADPKDKVYALVGMASRETAVIPDYSKSTEEIFYDVLEKIPQVKARFRNKLWKILGHRDCI